ncbi:sulfite exporter TauE/SafE family protein [Luteolibacter ambystomatis]|uniref:Probable membrane transporter protein n=1 Tax=Luteolibacter ambystomatis TaxID=2824561 RepID=A0A975G9H7_9BACT|nr:sulfite exporter TauE/SafE family protein [Luteolibacter ambystomatis]QUE51276.1 sulfite exporter TauE/SafE family protein [Luteolibacter ambystomatis]
MPHLSPAGYALAVLAALCIGLSKSGFSGISLVSVVLFAELYEAKNSVGLALPLLIAADLMAYPAFRKHGSWKPVWGLLLPTLAGLLIGCLVLHYMDDRQLRRAIGVSILVMVAVQSSRRLSPEIYDRWAHSRGCGTFAGLAGGFSTMLANAAGPVIQLYLLARRIPKMELIGTGARFFLLVNLIKVPLNAQLATITRESLLENAKLVPAVAAGVFGGRYLIKLVPQRVFEWMIVGFSLIAGIRLLFW